jgi:hypothetical protein
MDERGALPVPRQTRDFGRICGGAVAVCPRLVSPNPVDGVA